MIARCLHTIRAISWSDHAANEDVMRSVRHGATPIHWCNITMRKKMAAERKVCPYNNVGPTGCKKTAKERLEAAILM